MANPTSEQKFELRSLRPNELAAIEFKSVVTGEWLLDGKHVYARGCEHDATGIATVLQRQNPGLSYRLKVYRRVKS